MSNIISPDGKLWIKKTDDTIFEVGITQEHANATGLIWVLIPRYVTTIVNGEIVAHYESNKGLGSFRVPLTGTIEWNDPLIDTPDRITPDQWLFKVRV